MYCSKCGEKLTPTSKYCQSCGNPVHFKKIDSDKSTKKELTDKNTSSMPMGHYSSSLVNEAKKTAEGIVKQGVLWGIVGIVITGVTYMFAEPGGTYFILWGPMIYGGYKFLQGLYYYTYPERLVDKSIESLNKKLETPQPSDNQPKRIDREEKPRLTLFGWLVVIFVIGIFIIVILLSP